MSTLPLNDRMTTRKVGYRTCTFVGFVRLPRHLNIGQRITPLDLGGADAKRLRRGALDGAPCHRLHRLGLRLAVLVEIDDGELPAHLTLHDVALAGGTSAAIVDASDTAAARRGGMSQMRNRRDQNRQLARKSAAQIVHPQLFDATNQLPLSLMGWAHQSKMLASIHKPKSRSSRYDQRIHRHGWPARLSGPSGTRVVQELTQPLDTSPCGVSQGFVEPNNPS